MNRARGHGERRQPPPRSSAPVGHGATGRRGGLEGRRGGRVSGRTPSAHLRRSPLLRSSLLRLVAGRHFLLVSLGYLQRDTENGPLPPHTVHSPPRVRSNGTPHIAPPHPVSGLASANVEGARRPWTREPLQPPSLARRERARGRARRR